MMGLDASLPTLFETYDMDMLCISKAYPYDMLTICKAQTNNFPESTYPPRGHCRDNPKRSEGSYQ